MQLTDFSFDLPPELIAQEPREPRDSARLLVYKRSEEKIEHRTVKDLPDILQANTLIVANNSRVRHSRLSALLENKKVEILVLEQVQDTTYRCLLGKVHRPQKGAIFLILDSHKDAASPLSAVLLEKEESNDMGTYLLSFSGLTDIEKGFSVYGSVPLPPYIKNNSSSPERYQTTFNQEIGSAAAPTAGLHFTPELIKQLQHKGFGWEEVTLHVGLGTFLPLRHETLENNTLHSEKSSIPLTVAEKLNQQKKADQPILAIGTTAVRTLESHTTDTEVESGWLDTNMFIYPGYQFQTVTSLLTNFHLPKSSLLTLVAALLGNDPLQKKVVMSNQEMIHTLHYLYRIAIQEQYRFYSFGDAMLIL